MEERYRILLLLVFAACIVTTARAQCFNLTASASPVLERFVDHVPVVPRIILRGTTSRRPLTIGAYRIQQKLHRDLPPTTLYAFGTSARSACVPGPTLVAFKRIRSYVRWANNITDANHLLVVDPTLDRAMPRFGIPLVVHLHGGETAPPYDGHTDAWITNAGETGPNFTTNVYTYGNSQPSTLLWYHDHSFGYTRLSVAAGLAGLYLIVSPRDDPAWLPRSLRENKDGSKNPFIHDLILQDRLFYPNGSLSYPTVGINPTAHPNWCPDYFGDTILLNGKIWPYLNVSRGIHRFRFLAGGNSRFYTLSLNNSNLFFVKVGSDGGLLTTPVMQSTLGLSPSERADVLIDFSSLRVGDNVTVINIIVVPNLDAASGNNQPIIMFKVVNSFPPANAILPPNALTITPNLTIPETILATTGFNLSAVDLNSIRLRRFVITFNSTTLSSDGNATFRSPPTEFVQLYTDEVWEFINTVTADHPIHIHLINFFALNQQSYDVMAFAMGTCNLNVSFPDPRSCFTASPIVPDVDHLGWKDTTVVRQLTVARFYIPFRPREGTRFPFDPTASPGYVWHCHILEHEDNEMMRPLFFTN